jgi:3'-phosphoadenosine 5'-phosphosulfate (PAPS) 3'-phosphatase
MNYREKLEPILKMAGELALSLREEGLKVKHKQDGSPVTNADHAVSNFLIAALQAAFPGDAFFSEEDHDFSLLAADRIWFLDPIDGTRHYVTGNESFCIAAALHDKHVVFSAIYYPALDVFYYAERGKGAHRVANGEEKLLRLKEPRLPAVVHRSRTCDVNVGVEGSRGTMRHLLMLAKGEIDCFIQSEREYWDVCAPALIVEEAGGMVVDFKGKPLRISKDSVCYPAFVAGHPAAVKKVVEEIKLPSKD